MTACVNKKSKRVAAVVTASLVGALSIGAPAVALAANANIDMLEATPESAAKDGSIVSFVDANGDAAEAGATFVGNGKQQGIKPTMVQPWGTTAEDAQLEVSSFIVYKVVDATDTNAQEVTDRTIDGKSFYCDNTFGTNGKLTNQLPDQLGNYAVFAKVKVGGKEQPVKAGAKFSIVAAKLDDATLYQVNAKDTDNVSDTSYVFNSGDWQLTGRSVSQYESIDGYNRLGLAVGDTQLDTSKFSYEYYTAKGAKINGGDIKAAGDYYVIVSGKDASEYKGQKKRFDFTIAPYDLAKANVVASDVAWKGQGGDTTTKVVSVDSIAYDNSWIDTYTTVDYPNVATGLGKASLTLNVDEAKLLADGFAGSVINSQVVNYNVVSHLVTPKAFYGNKLFDAFDLAVDFSGDPTNAFDASKVSVTYTDPKTGKDVTTDKYTLRVVNKETQEVGGVEMLSNKGAYTVEAVLDSEALSWAVAGKSAALDVTVTKGNIGITDIAFAYNGKAITTVNQMASGISYTPGVDILDGLTVSVKTANGDLASSEYKVVATKTVDGKQVVVDSIEDAGTYKVSVVADGYSYDERENFINVVVAKRDISDFSDDFTANPNVQNRIRIKNTFDYTTTDNLGTVTKHRVVRYTGDVISPVFEWSVDGGKTWYELPSDEVSASYKMDGKKTELKKVGEYEATVATVKDAKNYEGTNSALNKVIVSDVKIFLDVPNNEWFSDAVYSAHKLGYINGYGDGKFFGPNDTITRAQVAVVLYNMADMNNSFDADDFKYDVNKYYETGFSDVDGHAYYANAIAWAKASGVVNGYADGTFRPDATITREEFCGMLSNYAVKNGDDVKGADQKVLDSFSDASSISDWSKAAMAWAVEADVMHGYADGSLKPAGTITRAQVAAMAVNYQPSVPEIIA